MLGFSVFRATRRWRTHIRFVVLLSFSLLIVRPVLTQMPKQDAYLDTNLPLAQRVDDLVRRMTVPEKISQMKNKAPAIPRLHIAEYDWWNAMCLRLHRTPSRRKSGQAESAAVPWERRR
jgi:beta-glucosidase